MKKELLTDREAAEFLTISKPTLWRYSKDKNFPQPIKIGIGCTRWKLADLELYIKKLSKK